MPRGQRIRLGSLVVCIMAIMAVRAQGQQFQTQPYQVQTQPYQVQAPPYQAARQQIPQYQTRQAAMPRTDSQRSPAKVFYFAVMGRVARPGVYELDRRFPSIVDLIERAGGLTSDASGNIRIIRNGRAGQQTFYSPKLRMSLLSSDLIVVNSRDSIGASSSKVSRIRTDSRTNSSRQAERSSQVELAFVNLIDRPVVLSIRSEHATLPAIVSLLGQFEDVASSVNVIPAYSTHNRGESYKDGSTALPSGSILVFDKSTIDVNRVPGLPKPFPLKRLEIPNYGQAAAPRPLQFRPPGGSQQPGLATNYGRRSFVPSPQLSNLNPRPVAPRIPKPIYQPRPTLSQRPAGAFESLPAPDRTFVTWPNRAATTSQPTVRSTPPQTGIRQQLAALAQRDATVPANSSNYDAGHVRIQSKPNDVPARLTPVTSEPVAATKPAIAKTEPSQPQPAPSAKPTTESATPAPSAVAARQKARDRSAKPMTATRIPPRREIIPQPKNLPPIDDGYKKLAAAVANTPPVSASLQSHPVHARKPAIPTPRPTPPNNDAARTHGTQSHVAQPQQPASDHTAAAKQAAAVEKVAATAAVRPNPKRKRRTQAQWLGIWGVGLGIVGIAFTLLWSMAKQDTTPKTFEKSDRYYLDAVINDDLTVTEETLSLPTTLQFYGRPVASKSFRLDTAHQPAKPKADPERPDSQFEDAVSGPHFKNGPPRPHFATAAAAGEKSSSAPQPAMTRSYLREAAAAAGRAGSQSTTHRHSTVAAPHVIAKPAATPSTATPSTATTNEPTNGLLDRVLSSVHGGPR